VSLSLTRKDDDKPVRVERQYEANLPQVPLDEGLSEQAFVNLIQNAYDAMGSGGGTLRVRVTRANRANRHGVEVRIEDTGPGIPAELREQIFNPFVTTKKTGVGLGLSIVSRIIDGHHGTIRVESGVDAQPGACFVLFFPASEEVNQQAS
jgi:signal transduction histidine kinase